jgi:dephospho-CoA kinase
MIIGLTSPFSGGKGTVAEHLKLKGYLYYSISDLIREEVVNRGLIPSREKMQDVGDEFRRIHGLDYWARGIVSTVMREGVAEDDFIIDSIRNPGEIERFREVYSKFILIGIDIDTEKQRELSLHRSSERDPQTKSEFERLRQRDLGISQAEYGQQVLRCLEMSDHLIVNKGEKEDLIASVEKILSNIK